MNKIALLGDSIRQLGYGNTVAAHLSDRFSVYQPDDNCRYSTYTYWRLYDWTNEMEGISLVHWNNGLWDMTDLYGDGPLYSEEEYIRMMKRIARVLLDRHGCVIFATTTPVIDSHPRLTNELIRRYNEDTVKELAAMGVVINDLFGFMYPQRDKLIMAEDQTHLTDEGIAVCASQVEKAICDTAKARGLL